MIQFLNACQVSNLQQTKSHKYLPASLESWNWRPASSPFLLTYDNHFKDNLQQLRSMAFVANNKTQNKKNTKQDKIQNKTKYKTRQNTKQDKPQNKTKHKTRQNTKQDKTQNKTKHKTRQNKYKILKSDLLQHLLHVEAGACLNLCSLNKIISQEQCRRTP